MTVFKNDERAVITETDHPNSLVVRGTFISPQGGALHLHCYLSHDDASQNDTAIFYHAPHLGELDFPAQDVLKKKHVSRASIRYNLTDDEYHDFALRQNGNDFISENLEDSSEHSLHATPLSFFKHFLLTEKGRDQASSLLLDQQTLEAAHRFYKTVILDPGFRDHPASLKTLLLKDDLRSSRMER